ncbi:hypothetical protein HNY73_001651 [Argiope bruennichi]|uniref:Uncharacterized protein n=1 Tax=Argiope bruennichi TaxID=94029 RepID=A0A8T0FQZ1_ARGBR|nr:hypothetical protein HNY73_001651 [Argiope bruennichi]
MQVEPKRNGSNFRNHCGVILVAIKDKGGSGDEQSYTGRNKRRVKLINIIICSLRSSRNIFPSSEGPKYFVKTGDSSPLVQSAPV